VVTRSRSHRVAGEIGSQPGFGIVSVDELCHDRDAMISRLEQLCLDKGLKMTEQRRVIARVLSESADHPDVEQVYRRATAIDARISIATVYRTVRLFEEASILARHDFGDGRSRYEEMPSAHHDHLIDLQSGRVIEFRNEEIERLQEIVADQLGYELVGHRLELYAVPRGRKLRTATE
jgi:Fur family transcriptional regulator, ferric uptake regulator